MVHLNKQFINLLFLPYIWLYLTVRVPRVLSEELNIEPWGRTPVEPEKRNNNMKSYITDSGVVLVLLFKKYTS